jgi:hypothetical protein
LLRPILYHRPSVQSPVWGDVIHQAILHDSKSLRGRLLSIGHCPDRAGFAIPHASKGNYRTGALITKAPPWEMPLPFPFPPPPLSNGSRRVLLTG